MTPHTITAKKSVKYIADQYMNVYLTALKCFLKCNFLVYFLPIVATFRSYVPVFMLPPSGVLCEPREGNGCLSGVFGAQGPG